MQSLSFLDTLGLRQFGPLDPARHLPVVHVLLLAPGEGGEVSGAEVTPSQGPEGGTVGI